MIRKNLQRKNNFILRTYKLFISPTLKIIFKGGCRYQPTCSEYADRAVEKYGIAKGGILSLIRILRCNPLSKHARFYPLE